jgi:DNA (cytosine-5)-methyltransferase 1
MLLYDIRFRMLQPRELARAQGFPDHYQFSGTKAEVTKLIGNAVPVSLAEALCRELLA